MYASRFTLIIFLSAIFTSSLFGIKPWNFETGEPMSTQYLYEIVNLLKMGQDVQNTVTTSDFTDNQHTVSTAGVHTVQQSIEFADPDSTSISAIVVDKDNVTIDLNGQHITNTSSTTDLCGIIVNACKKNIKIMNGTISGFPGYGIKIEGNSGCKNGVITIENVDITDCGSGISLKYVTNGLISNCNIISNTNTAATNGISIDNCTSISVENSAVNTNEAGTGDMVGVLTSNSKSIKISECSIHENSSTSGDAYGMKIIDSSNCIIDKNKIIKNSTNASSESAYGIYLSGTTDSRIEENKIDGHKTCGITDAALDSTSLFVKNIAFDNGTNYNVSYGSEKQLNVMETGSAQFTPLVHATSWDNISVVRY